MPSLILQEFVARVQEQFEQLRELLLRSLDFAALEEALTGSFHEALGAVLGKLLQGVLTDRRWLDRLKRLGGRLGMRFKEYRVVRVRLGQGQVVEVWAPYFVKAAPKRGRRKRGPNGRGASLGLEVLGFSGRCSSRLVSEVVQLAVLCPSYEVARQVLARRGVVLDVKTVRRLCRLLGERGVGQRGAVSLGGDESLSGRTLVIGIDGGRLRQRRRKRGRRKAGAKRQGYHAEWKEPKLFTLYVLDAEGQVVKEFAPLHDATMGDHQAMMGLLEQYLRALDLSEVARVVFCGDGAPWIWSGVQALCTRLGWDESGVHQVLDYTHAKQNLQEILECVPPELLTSQRLEQTWKELLWQGDIAGLYRAIEQLLTGDSRTQALKKWHDYFQPHAQRMQYQQFRNLNIPCGSGCVESAIRRVINLRLKAPGTFWTRDMAEYFLFLRSQVLSGRWDIVLTNIARQTAKLLLNQPDDDFSEPSAKLLTAA